MKKRMQRFVVALMATMMFTSISPVSALATEMPVPVEAETEVSTEPGEVEPSSEMEEIPQVPEEETEAVPDEETENEAAVEALEQQLEAGNPVVEEDVEPELLQASDSYLNLTGICYNIRNNGVDVGVAYDTDAQSVDFRWEAYNLDTQSWSVIADWNGGNWATWTPTAGNYWLHAEARTASGRTADYTICFYAPRDYNDNYLALNGICYIDHGHTIDVGVNYDTASSSVQFRWQSYNLDTQGWETIADWNGGNWATWTPKKGNYWLQVQAKAADGNVKAYTICFAATKNYSTDYVDLNGICMIQDYNKVDMGVSYESSDSNVKFMWQVYDVNAGSWTTVSNWSKSNWTTWNVTSGSYWINVTARTSKGTVESFCQGVNLQDKNYIAISGITMNKHSHSVDLNVNYTSGDTNMNFMWQIYALSTNTWTTISDWSASTQATWNVSSGSYWVNVTARNGAGKTVSYCEGVNLQSKFNYVAFGNSLTAHPIVAGLWWGNWGMAATTPDKDYFHLVTSGLQQDYANVTASCHYLKSWEEDTNRNNHLGEMDPYLNADVDLVTIQLGDNIVAGKETLYNDFYNIVAHVKEKAPNAQIMVVSSFCWPDPTVTAAQINACNELGATFIDLSPISGNPAYRAGTGGSVYGEDGAWHTITNGAVGAHPNDAGFAYIAQQILANIK